MTGRPTLPELLDAGQVRALQVLLDGVLPYPPIEGGPTVQDTVAFVLRRLEHEDRAVFGPLEAVLTRITGREHDWLEATASSPQHPDRAVFDALRGWAWDGFLADPRWGVNRGGLGWSYVGWPGAARHGRPA